MDDIKDIIGTIGKICTKCVNLVRVKYRVKFPIFDKCIVVLYVSTLFSAKSLEILRDKGVCVCNLPSNN